MNDHCPGRGDPTREQNPAYGLLQPIKKQYQVFKTGSAGQVYVDDQKLWHLGTTRIESLLADLPVGVGESMTTLLTRYHQAKEALDEVVAEVDAASVCCECSGQCCMNGKYRMNIFDAMARIAEQIPTSADFSQKPVCPYGTEAGCTMEPGLRPADCVLFVCDEIDQRLSPKARLLFSAQERLLRECISEASILTGEPMGTPLLLWAGKHIPKQSL